MTTSFIGYSTVLFVNLVVMRCLPSLFSCPSPSPPLPLAPPAAGYSQAAGRAAGPDAGATGGSQQTESSAADEQVCVCVGGGLLHGLCVCVCMPAHVCVTVYVCVV